MLPIYIYGNWHHKNRNGLHIVKETAVRPWNGERDGIILTNELNMDIHNQYDNVIMGPGVDFKQGIDYFKSYQGEKKIIFNTLSPWNKKLHDRYAPHPNITYITLPFPVDVEKFRPAEKKKRFFIYFKHVHSSRLQAVLDTIQRHPERFGEYEYKIFRYGSYQENEYLEYIMSSSFGIWIGSHESQGFALEEALSCNCPLFVYDVTTMKDECFHDSHHPWGHVEEDLPATTASYFDETCGTIYHEGETLDDKILYFMNSFNQCTPREFVMRHLTTSSFVEKLNHIIKVSPVVSVNIMGGLGNQMFQIASAYAYARKEGGTLKIIHKLDNGNRPVYWETLLQKVKPYLVSSIPSTLEQWSEKLATMYADRGPLSSKGKYLNGYLQTSKYFYDDTIKQEIKELCTPHDSLFKESKARYAYLLENKERVVVMHARRTDYLKAAGVHGPLTGAYYREAVQRMMGRIKNPIFLLCSDDQTFWNEIRNDIAPVFENENIVLEDSDIHTFVLLQQFHHFIMANSSFIWWCVWLSDAKNVIAPSKWFGPEGPTPYDDIFEESWERIE